MPRKPNRRDTQPYVPAGHGDESGEYRGYEAGDTYRPGYKPKGDGKGKVVPKGTKPKDDASTNIVIKEKPIEEKPKDKKPLPSEIQGKVKEYIKRNSTYSKNDIKNINRIIEKGSDECNKIIGDAYEKGNYTFEKLRSKRQSSAFCPNQNKIEFNSNALSGEYAYKEDGETFYHENGHLIDGLNGYNNEFSLTFVSEKYGKTLNEMVKEEGKSFVDNDTYDTLKAEEEKYKRKLIPKLSGLSKEEIDEYYMATDKIKQINDKLDVDFSAKRKDLAEKKMKGEITPDEAGVEWDRYISKYHQDADAEIAKYKDIQSKNRSKITFGEISAIGEVSKVYGAVEDVVNGAYDGYKGTLTYHPAYYWGREGNKGREFFAENFAAIALNNKTQEVMARYFPKSHEIVKEIIRSVQNG